MNRYIEGLSTSGCPVWYRQRENSFNNYINRYTYLPYVWMNDPKSPLSIYQWNNIVYTLWWGGSCTFHFMHKSIQKERWVLLSESDMNKLPKWFKFDPCDPQSVKQVETTLGRKLETGIELWGKWNTKLTNALSDPIDEKLNLISKHIYRLSKISKTTTIFHKTIVNFWWEYKIV